MSTLVWIVGIVAVAVVTIEVIKRLWPKYRDEEVAAISEELVRIHKALNNNIVVSTWAMQQIDSLNQNLVKIALERDKQFHELELKELQGE